MTHLTVDIGWRPRGQRKPGFALEIAFDTGAGATILFGPSGAGKTATLRCIAGLERPQRGRIDLNGVPFSDAEAGVFLPPAKRGFGVVFQEARLFPHLSVRKNLLYGAPDRKSAALDEIVDLLGIEALLERRTHRLSGGEAQRVAIGRALLRQPRMLLMDEPLANLDPARKEEVLPYLEALTKRAGCPILYVTHSAEEARRLGDRMIRIVAGRVAETGGRELIRPAATR
jgi:molybdate transport system ATP-binding protein